MYDFKQLSPADFEELTRDLLQKEWGVYLESFASGRDSGIDFRYAKSSDNATIVQCKHFIGSGFSKLISHLRSSETEKLVKLNPSRYVLSTSIALTPLNKQELRALLAPYALSEEDIIGADDLNNLLRRHPEVEKANFKLWLSSVAVLNQVLHNAEIVQAKFEVERVRKRLPLYVQSSAYPEAVKILQRERVVVISGVPGIGKTTLADLLLYAHLEQGYEPVIIKSDISEAKKLFSKERKQIFYYDDFLGQTLLVSRPDFLGRREDAAILDFVEMVASSESAMFILTTREHLLQQAFGVSERFERERMKFAGRSCVLDMGHYGILERGRILYNHIYFSDLPSEYKLRLLDGQFYMTIIQHRNFNPRLIEWLSQYQNVQNIDLGHFPAEVLSLLEEPTKLWRVAFEHQLSDAARSLLLMIYALGGEASLENELRSSWNLLHKHRSLKYNFRTAAEDWLNCLKELQGSFLLMRDTAQFVNPSVKDFLDSNFCANTDHALDIVVSADRFRPINVLWSLAESEKGEKLMHWFAEQLSFILPHLQRCLHSPVVIRPMGWQNGRFVPAIKDIPYFARIEVLLRILEKTRSLGLARLIQSGLKRIDEIATEEVVEYDYALAVVGRIRGSQYLLENFIDSIDHIKTFLISHLEAEPLLEGFVAVANYIEDDVEFLATGDVNRLSVAFDGYVKNGFVYDLENADSESALEDLGSHLSWIEAMLSCDVSYEQEQVAQKLHLEQEKSQVRGGNVTNWSSKRSSNDGAEQEVRRIFDGLSGCI